MSFFLSFLFWVVGANADVSPTPVSEWVPTSNTSELRYLPDSRTRNTLSTSRVKSRMGGGTVIILEDTHFKPTN